MEFRKNIGSDLTVFCKDVVLNSGSRKETVECL